MCLFLSYPSPWISLTLLNLSDSLLAVVCDVYEQIENVQGGQNRGINPEHRLQLKPTTQHLTKEGEKVLRKQLQQSHGIFFLFSVHICSMPNKSLESLELAHADKTAIKGVVNTWEERGEKQNKKASHWHVKLFGTTAESKMYLTSVVNQQYMSLSRQWRRKDYPLLLLLWNTFSFKDKSVHHWWCFDFFLLSRKRGREELFWS